MVVPFFFTRAGRDVLFFFGLLATFIVIHEAIHFAFAYIFGLNPYWSITAMSGGGFVWLTLWSDLGQHPVINLIIIHSPSAFFLLSAVALIKLRYPFAAFAMIIAGVHAIWGHIVFVV